MKMYLELTRDEINSRLPYSMIAMTRFGSAWGTMQRKRRWMEEFSEEEREAAQAIFRKAYSFTLATGTPDTLKLTVETLALWEKLGDFCASI